MNKYESFNSQEQILQTFIYVDNSAEDHPVVFTCEATDITQADEKYKETIGKDVSKQPHIGCYSPQKDS